MKKFAKKIVAILIVALIASQSSFVYALEKEWRAEDLSEDQQRAFITRTEFTDWVTAFTASLSEVDKNATQKIFDNMDFYDLQYKITILYDFDENNKKWYSDSIERPEGFYKMRNQSTAGEENLKQQLENMRTDATAWEKWRRDPTSASKPYASPADQQTQHTSGTKTTDKDYVFDAK